MATRPLTQVDVFTAEPLLGNPVAVVHDADGIDPADMQRFATWMNLSETTFLTAPRSAEADYGVRIFTPDRELPFAGHPTLGSCHAWLAAGGRPRGRVVVQECGVGLVPIRREASGALMFAAPQRSRSGPLDERDVELLVRGLGIDRADVVDHQWCDNGPPWQALLLPSAAQVLEATPDVGLLDGRFVGLVGPHPDGAEAAFEVRAFFPVATGLGEDPVTGSLNAAVGQWLVGSGRAPERYVAAQGTALGRVGRVHVEHAGDDLWVGGGCVTVVDGRATFGHDLG